VRRTSKEARPITCVADECSGAIERSWWSERGDRVFFSRQEGIDRNWNSTAFYAWSPANGTVAAHLHAIMNRNLDWFRFWLQDYEDPVPTKKAQYARWRKLRGLQCKNPRSLRNYCRAMDNAGSRL
jgi:hypothetical protein